jgi:hypothetical protein
MTLERLDQCFLPRCRDAEDLARSCHRADCRVSPSNIKYYVKCNNIVCEVQYLSEVPRLNACSYPISLESVVHTHTHTIY